MSEPTLGIALKAGWQREATVIAPTWPATSAALVTTLLPMLTLQGNDGVQKSSYQSNQSGLGAGGFDILAKAPSVPGLYKVRYQGLESLWACALGYMAKRIGSTLLPEQLATGVYRHLFELDARLSTAQGWCFGDGFRFGTELTFGQRRVRRGTFAADYQVSVWEWLSSMVQAITIQAGLDGVTLSLELVAHSLSRTSAVNTLVTMSNALPLVAPNVLFTDMVIRVAPYSAVTPLGSGDVVHYASWTLRLENNLSTIFGPRTGLAPEEYERRAGDVPRATLTFVDPRHTADTWQTRWGANTTLMADAKCTSEGLIPGTALPYQHNWYFPSCQVINAQLETAGAALPPDTVQLVGIVPSAPAAGFPTMHSLTPLALEVVSGLATHPLL